MYKRQLQQDAERTKARGLIYHHVLKAMTETVAPELAEIQNLIGGYENILATPGIPEVARAPIVQMLHDARMRLEDATRPAPMSFQQLQAAIAQEGQEFRWILQTYQGYSREVFGGHEGASNLAGMLVVRELGRRPKRQNNLETMGMIAVRYPRLDLLNTAPMDWTSRGFTLPEWKDFLKVAVDHFVRGGGSLDIPDLWRNWIGIRFPRNWIVPPNQDEVARGQRRWPSARRSRDRSALVRLLAHLLRVDVDTDPGQDAVDSLLAYARETNPEYAALRSEADAFLERVVPAGALPDPKFRMELRDITRFGEQSPTVSPSRVGSTRYLLTQDLPWFGKRDLRREIAEFEAEGATGRARGSWSDLAARIRTAHAQRYYLHGNTRLTQEILDLMLRLEKVAQVRYAGGLAAQQDVIRAQVEQTSMRSELVSLESESRQVDARLNALLARPAAAALAEPEELPRLPAPAQLEFATLAERVRARNPLLAAEESRLKAAEKSRDLAYRNRYPDFTVGFGPIQYDNAVKEWELMVELNIPLQPVSYTHLTLPTNREV